MSPRTSACQILIAPRGRVDRLGFNMPELGDLFLSDGAARLYLSHSETLGRVENRLQWRRKLPLATSEVSTRLVGVCPQLVYPRPKAKPTTQLRRGPHHFFPRLRAGGGASGRGRRGARSAPSAEAESPPYWAELSLPRVGAFTRLATASRIRSRRLNELRSRVPASPFVEVRRPQPGFTSR